MMNLYGWKCQTVDGSMVKAPLGTGKSGEKPRGSGKKGTKRSGGSHGLPVGIVLDRADRHDIKLLEQTLLSIITARPKRMNVCLDAGYVGGQDRVEGMGHKAHIRGCGEERQEKEDNP
jgi:uncharacterized protein YwbE